MDIGNKTIEEWFLEIDIKKQNIFPYDFDYVTRYKNYKNILNEWIHPYVEKGAMIADGGCLNDHGPNHISKVIYNASQLIKSTNCNLTEYEVYILLMAIHLHDVGNIYGRNGHEVNSIYVIDKLKNDAGDDRIEWDYIFDIAEAHGGKEKDKITDLTTQYLLSFSIRLDYLAALLKFSDELSDDRTRANKFLKQHRILPLGSEIFHMYSYCLHSVQIDLLAKQINIYFDIEENDLYKEYIVINKSGKRKSKKKRYLLDEIYSRTYKMHTERMYCMRFLRPSIEINKIRVSIIINLNEKNSANKRIKKYINYDLGEVGYPDGNGMNGVFVVVPKLKEFTAEKIIDLLRKNSLKDVNATY